jgi:hypothetical protein
MAQTVQINDITWVVSDPTSFLELGPHDMDGIITFPPVDYILPPETEKPILKSPIIEDEIEEDKTEWEYIKREFFHQKPKKQEHHEGRPSGISIDWDAIGVFFQVSISVIASILQVVLSFMSVMVEAMLSSICL